MMRTWRPAIAICALALCACGSDHVPAPTVASAEVIRGAFTLERDDHEERVVGTARVENQAEAATGEDGRGVVTLDSGAWILLDRSSRATVELAAIQLSAGRAWVDASNADETTVRTEHGSVRASNATFAVELGDGNVSVYCASGELTYESEGGSDRLAQGERVVLAGSTEPNVEPADLWDDWTGGLADPGRARYPEATHLGVLAGRRLDETGHARTPLPIRAHEVNVTVRGDLAVTEVVQTFFNARSDVLEGEWGIRLPRGAIVQAFAIDQGAGFQESVVNAMSVAEGYQLSWMGQEASGAKLTYDGPDRLRARIYPVSPGATVRVRLRYTEWLDRVGDKRTYVYPMRVEGEPPLLGEFILQVDTSGALLRGLRAGMGATTENGRVVLRRSDFRPRADFSLDLYDETAPSADQVTSYVVSAPAQQGGGPQAEGQESYVLFDIPTEAIVDEEEDATPPPLELVMLLDVSGETDPEDLEIARAVIEAVLRQVTPTDRVAIRLADVSAHAAEGAPDGLVEATEENREALLESIARVNLGGATDLGRSLREAAQLVAGRPRAAVLYLGDGLPTTGDLDATALRATLATLDSPPRFFGLAIGDGSNVGLLRRLFDGNAELVTERTEAARIIMRVLAEAAQPTLRGVSVDLGENVERVYPRPPILVHDGEHLRLVGRLVGELPTQITVRGSFDGEAFERRMTVARGLVEDNGDIRKRWGQDRLAELIDEDAGREAMVDLGLRFGLVSPWTSLVVGGMAGGTVAPVTGFDHDPLGVAWGLGGGEASVPAAMLTSDESGWRRRLRRDRPDPAVAPEATWVSRVSEDEPAGPTAGGAPPRGRGRGADSGFGADGGLARAAVQRALVTGERGPRGCYERRSIVRPDLAGEMTVEVQVDGQGNPESVNIVRNTLGDDDVQRCVQTEIRGLRFPATGNAGTVTVSHTLSFQMPEREFGTRRQCSDASQQPLEVRRNLWRERLNANAGVGGALSVWREASRQCELANWRARRTLLHMMLGHVGGVPGQVALYRAFSGNESVADYLRRIILRNVRSPADVMAVRAGLGLDVPVDWTLFSTLWKRNPDPRYRLALVRRWLEVVPEEMDLRLRLLSLLEQTDGLAEARRLARELRADPLADARVRTAVGEFWLRQENEAEARRVFSEIVERTPLDPWARRRLGDLYRAHHWADDAYREYRTLSRLRPGDGEVLLLLARAAADAGRIDEALRLEQRLSESTDPGVDEGAAGYARLWTTVRLARLKLDEHADQRAVRRRERESGALREPPAIFAALTWDHPDDHPELRARYPSTDEDVRWEVIELGGRDHGIYATSIREREEGEYLFEVRRNERDEIRDLAAELIVITNLGTPEEHIERLPITLTREATRLRYRLEGDGSLAQVDIPANERDQ